MVSGAAMRRAAVAGLLAVAGCGVVSLNPVIDRAEDTIRAAHPSWRATVSDAHQCGGAEAVTGELTFLNDGGAWERQSFVYAKGELALQEDADAFNRLMAVCDAAMQGEIGQVNANRAAINPTLANRGAGSPP